MRSMMKKTTLREIRQSFGRYFAILAIVMLGVGFFAGLKVTKEAMVAAGQEYLEENALYDFRLLSTYGFEEEDAAALRKKPGVRAAQGAYSADILFVTADDENERVLRCHSLTEGVNELVLTEGRMPAGKDECVVDSVLFDASVIGKKIVLSENNAKEDLECFACGEYTVTGLVQSSLYTQFERGNTSIGNGKVSGFAYLLPEGFALEYFTELYIKLDEDLDLYSDAYDAFIKEEKPIWEGYCKEQARRRYDEIVDEAKKEVAEAEDELADGKKEAYDEFEKAKGELEEAEKEIEEGERQLADAREEIKNAESRLAAQKGELDYAESMLAVMSMAGVPTEETAAQLAYGRAQLAAADSELAAAKKELEEKEDELADAKREVAEGWEEYEEALAEFEEELAGHEAELADAKREIEELEGPDTYVLGRETNVGYVCFESDSDIVNGIANVFPVFFFLVAALVCMTTMNRMVEEQRTQIGILKALGYGEWRIMGKYLFYSGSAAFAGAVLGFFVGTYGMPRVIWFAYGILYRMGDIKYVFNGKLAVISLIVALACSMGTTYVTCIQVMRKEAAVLMRPKSPKAGKRVLLERIPLIWKRMKFLQKVSYRNVVRYKKRFFMMVIGIGGCTALLVTAFGLKDSIADIAKLQFHEIQTYDLSVTLRDGLDGMDEQDREKILSLIDERGGAFMPVQETTLDIVTAGQVKSVNLVVAGVPDEIGEYLDLHTKDHTPVSYPQTGSVVLSDKIAGILNIRVGDSILLRNEDMKELTVTVSGIFRNYVYNYIYMDEQTYEAAFGEVRYKGLYVVIRKEEDPHALSAALMGVDGVNAVSVNADTEKRVSSMMASLDYIVVVVVLCAAALAFIVLYNLNNINITERVGEIATLKVLGFYRRETEKYVFKENLALTGIGCALGLLLGKALHAFVMHEINIDMVAFDVRVKPVSYGLSVVLTFVFALTVNRLMSVKLDRINMAESLKSVD